MPFAGSFFFNDTATTEIYTLSLHDALPIFTRTSWMSSTSAAGVTTIFLYWSMSRELTDSTVPTRSPGGKMRSRPRPEEQTSELQSRQYLVCRLLLEKKKNDPQLTSPVIETR